MSGLWPPAERLLRCRAPFNSDGDRGWHMADSCREIQGAPAPMLPIRGDAPHRPSTSVKRDTSGHRHVAFRSSFGQRAHWWREQLAIDDLTSSAPVLRPTPPSPRRIQWGSSSPLRHAAQQRIHGPER
ncbi:hypothetical protein PVAP13_5KG495207 [Panicum virgatum]|uniref:Uncharacterized protein n=1 Tax=Panicum virgatum TaxID=38727 RepID=A0A8T0ST90_PANVG|nr:hypothetical protein PVAP13_5KG495207 [Panicum virgatum]